MSDSAIVQELASTRAALRQAIELGEKLQSRVDAALVIADAWAESPEVLRLRAALRGEQ